jgi:hypothetical protein
MESLTRSGLRIKLNPIRVKGFAQPQLNPVNPLTQLTQPEIRDKANAARDKDFILLWLNPAYPTVTRLLGPIPHKIFALTQH